METNELTTGETAGLDVSAEDMAAFDAEWGDAPAEESDFELNDESDAEEPRHQREEASTAEEAEKEADADGSNGQEGTPSVEESESDADKDELFTLKVLGAERQVSREELIQLAQKGSDYDHVRAERDQLRGAQSKSAEYENFLTELAAQAGTDIKGLIEMVRAQMPGNQESAEGKAPDQEKAEDRASQIVPPSDGNLSDADAAAPLAQGDREKEAQRQQTLSAFLSAYPQVQATDIPQEVWQESFRTGDLVGAYARYENKRLKAENETLKQNKKNAERSTGSRRSAGAATPKDPFDEAWDAF